MKIRSSSILGALKIRDFRLLWFGLFISAVGSQMQTVAINWHVYLLTKSALSLGLIGLSRSLPLIIFSIFSGVAADIFDRKKLVIVAQIIMAICALILTIASFSGNITPLLIYVITAVNSLATSVDIPGRHSLYPLIVPKKMFANATSLISIMWRASQILGPAIGGLIIASLGVKMVYLINAVSFLTIIVALFLIKPKPQTFASRQFKFSAVREGFSYVFKSDLIRSTMLLDFFASFFATANVLLPIYVKEILLAGPKELGLLYAAAAVGGVVGGLLIASIKHLKNQGKIILVSVFVYGLSTLVFAFSKSFYLCFICLAIAGFCDIISGVIRTTLRQLKTPDVIRGRMVAVNMIFFYGGPELGELEAGLLASVIGAPLSVLVGGIGAVAATIIIGLRTPKLRKYQGNELLN